MGSAQRAAAAAGAGDVAAAGVSLLTASCHCGAVRLELRRKPRTLTNCNCSICRRYGALWAYCKASAVRIVCAADAIERYRRGGGMLEFCRCRTCGCISHHERVEKRADSTVGVNARNIDPDALGEIRIRRLDGAASWKYLD
jgi:hypothetical protein